MSPPTHYTEMIREFFRLESAGGLLLVAASVLAVAMANSLLGPLYQGFLDTRLEVRVGAFEIAKPLLLWINDGLMAVFFFLVGLEIKREFLEGELSSASRIALPGLGAIGGMAVPALIYVAFNWGSAENLNGWAIPAATDIAFALAVLSLLGDRIRTSLKALLLAVAIFDDLGAIIIIALFYTQDLSLTALSGAAAALAALVAVNRFGVQRLAPYVLLGIILWVLVLKSGVHATLAGVATALAIPLAPKDDTAGSLLKHAEHALHPWVAFAILPLFAFANAGVSFTGIGLQSLLEPVKLGISLGLFLGKQIGVFGLMALGVALGLVSMPRHTTWLQLYGVSLLTGIGFTMSLFIGSLAFEHSDFDAPIRLGVIVGSLASALLGYVVLRLATEPGGGGENSGGP
ncbi:MAG: Na+/H+ antiporter NhaA [Methyloligellaceae bacterium]